MKKFLILILSLVLITGCGAEKVKDNNNENNDRVGYSITIEGTKIMVGDEFSKISSKLGKDYEYQEVETCAFEGMDKIYSYSDYEIYNYHEKGVEKIYTITLLNENVSTDEGITIGSTVEEVVDTYGDNYEDVAGSYVFQKGDTILTFIFDDGVVTSIEFKIELEGINDEGA